MKRKFFFIGGIVILLIAISGVWLWQNQNANATKTIASVQTATVKRGTLAVTVSAAGNRHYRE